MTVLETVYPGMRTRAGTGKRGGIGNLWMGSQQSDSDHQQSSEAKTAADVVQT